MKKVILTLVFAISSLTLLNASEDNTNEIKFELTITKDCYDIASDYSDKYGHGSYESFSFAYDICEIVMN